MSETQNKSKTDIICWSLQKLEEHMKEDAQNLTVKQQEGKLTGLPNTQDLQSGATMGRDSGTLFASSKTSKWEKVFRQGIRSYKDSLLHVCTSQTFCPRRKSTVK